ncbi:MAG TPA: sigma-70 family RNA polymerase sigma factor [Vicinamibacterales bacterium]|nr:sigma-70 family RNA polymerase sigma factor [Vicinamibacterales bacterium]
MTRAGAIDDVLARRLHTRARADRWRLAPARFARALAASDARGLRPDADPAARERYLSALHLEDLALACACADGHDEAWEHLLREYRPLLHRAADALDPTGGARELADALYGDLYGTTTRDGTRRSLFEYFHGRSSLATWLRSVLAQRHIDRLRAARRTSPLPDDDSSATPLVTTADTAPDRPRRPHAAALARALGRAIGDLSPRERLRLGCYYAQEMTLKAIGRLTGEHEATVSRQLARSRESVRAEVVRILHTESALTDAQIAECFAAATADAGTLDLTRLLGPSAPGKNPAADRSREETP